MAAAPTDVAIKFVLYEKEQNVDIMKESRLYQDIIFVPGGNTTDYRSIVFKTFAFVQVQPVLDHAVCARHSCSLCLSLAMWMECFVFCCSALISQQHILLCYVQRSPACCDVCVYVMSVPS